MTLDPEAKLARALSEALAAYAEDKIHQETAVAAEPEPIVEDAALPTPRGPRQKEVAEALIAAPLEGWKTGEIAHMVDMDQPNAYLTLQALQKQSLAEMVPGSDPQRWRLPQRYRQRQSILRAAGLVRRGEFTTYGDISQVVYGHGRGGQAVGQVAMRDPEFPHPHRVLAKGGQIPATWAHTDGTGSAEDARRLLEQDAVKILHDDDGRLYAHPRHYINHEELSARLRQSGVPVNARKLPASAVFRGTQRAWRGSGLIRAGARYMGSPRISGAGPDRCGAGVHGAGRRGRVGSRGIHDCD